MDFSAETPAGYSHTTAGMAATLLLSSLRLRMERLLKHRLGELGGPRHRGRRRNLRMELLFRQIQLAGFVIAPLELAELRFREMSQVGLILLDFHLELQFLYSS